ncbi:left-right determination factor 1-like [Crocuta crocuta]
MGPLWLCWVLWALPLLGPGAALTGEQVLESLLRQLGLSEAPVPAQRDAEEPATPAHVRAQYVALLRRSHGARSRGKRFSQRVREPPRCPKAVNFWRQLSRPGQPLLLQVSVQREHLGPRAPGAHKLVRFASQGREGTGQAEPQLELHSLDLGAYGARGDCDPGAPVAEGARCCRQEMYIDLRGMTWAQHWVLEPPGFLAYECVGACRQPPGPSTFTGPFLGPRRCIASETTSLPVIVSVKEGGRSRPQVVSLPNMRVEKCACSWDGAPVPRKLGP